MNSCFTCHIGRCGGVSARETSAKISSFSRGQGQIGQKDWHSSFGKSWIRHCVVITEATGSTVCNLFCKWFCLPIYLATKAHALSSLKDRQSRGDSRTSPRRGAPIPRGCLPNILVIFSEKPYEIKEILLRTGEPPLNPPLDTITKPQKNQSD